MPARFCPWSVNDKKSVDEKILDTAESMRVDAESMRADALALLAVLVAITSIIDRADTGSKRFKDTWLLDVDVDVDVVLPMIGASC